MKHYFKWTVSRLIRHGCTRHVTNQDDPCENAFESDGFLPVSIHGRGTPAAREILLLPERVEARDLRHTSHIPASCHSVSFLSLEITHLGERLRIEASEFIIFYGKADLDRFAAYLAVFNVGLAADG